jgi:hypothetical protein
MTTLKTGLPLPRLEPSTYEHMLDNTAEISTALNALAVNPNFQLVGFTTILLVVLPLDMVDNSISPCEHIAG